MKRTHTCGELTEKNIGKEVLLQGWVSSRRDHGGVIFIDLRDRYGLTQIVFNPDFKDFSTAEKLRREDVIEITGKVRNRPKEMENPKLKTGKIEVLVSHLEVLNKAATPPLEVDDRIVASDEVRLKYRYLDLRRPGMQQLLQSGFEAGMAARKFLHTQNFIEIETPMLMKSTPEGARDYIVPSRVNPGKFYALPQSPQIYKQICMVAGFDRYFQFPRCLRDEDLRMDRQPEHTQIDLEMSFVQPEDVFQIVEGIMQAIWETKGVKLKTPFQKIPYDEAMRKYGTDKPDLRYELFLHEVTDIVKESDFSVFKEVIKTGGIVKCINPEKEFSRNEVDDLIHFAQQHGAKGMAWMRVTSNGLESNIVKYFPDTVQRKLLAATKAKKGYLFFIADSIKMTNAVLDKLRQELAKRMNLINAKEYRFCWINQFPLFEWNEDEGKWDPAHHMFCMPLEEDLKHLEKDPGNVKCTQYDLVLNGVELGSGSIRINRPDIQERVMKVIGLTQKELEYKFGFLLEAFRYGAPPHGGIGLGFDRIVALLNGLEDIREVIAFPKNKAAECPMDGSPAAVDEKQLKELHIKLDVGKKK